MRGIHCLLPIILGTINISGGRGAWVVILSAAKRLALYRPHFAKDGSETGFGMPFVLVCTVREVRGVNSAKDARSSGVNFPDSTLRAECSPIEKRTI